MALSLLYNPVDYSSAHGDLIFTLLEDTKPFNSSLYPDYKYVCDVYVAGSQVARLKAFPRPGDKLGVFNIGNVVRNYFDNVGQLLYAAPNSIIARTYEENEFYLNVICRFGEEYGGTTFSNILVDSQRSYFNHYNGRLLGVYTNLADKIDKAATNRPYKTSVYSGSKWNLIPFIPSDDTTFNLIIKKYNAGNTLLGTTTIPISPTALSTNQMHVINASPYMINFEVPGFIDGNVTYYTVEFNTTNITGDSIYRFDIICEPKYEVFTLHFLNQYGGYESKSFTKVSRKMNSVEKSSFGKSPYLIFSDGNVTDYNTGYKTYYEQKSNYAVAWSDKMVLNTDILSDNEYVWLRDLILSPLAYIEINDYFIPISITDNNYELKKVINDDLTNLTLNIEFGDRFNTQYR